MAKFVEWSDDLSVGIEEIDVQHQVLVRLINEMHEAIGGRPRQLGFLAIHDLVCAARH